MAVVVVGGGATMAGSLGLTGPPHFIVPLVGPTHLQHTTNTCAPTSRADSGKAVTQAQHNPRKRESYVEPLRPSVELGTLT